MNNRSDQVKDIKKLFSEETKAGKIVFLNPIHGGITKEIQNTMKEFDVGIIISLVKQTVQEANAGICFGESEEDIISKVNYLCEHPEELKQMKINAYKFAKETFNYDNYGKSLIKMIENIK